MVVTGGAQEQDQDSHEMPRIGDRNHLQKIREEEIKNPLNSAGQITKCTICSSTYHWMRDCPHRNAKKSALTMFTDASIQKCYLEKLVGETFLSALLDSGSQKRSAERTGWKIMLKPYHT